ncbi:hypothetical protein V1478_013161 [Vespula squamosa]|uniref:Uncharacterized protein n=1 Tax=Vespula squamosa TaxID=30214 RepID=A0ABD2AA10_VESSQ
MVRITVRLKSALWSGEDRHIIRLSECPAPSRQKPTMDCLRVLATGVLSASAASKQRKPTVPLSCKCNFTELSHSFALGKSAAFSVAIIEISTFDGKISSKSLYFIKEIFTNFRSFNNNTTTTTTNNNNNKINNNNKKHKSEVTTGPLLKSCKLRSLVMALRLGRAFVRFQVGDITGNFNYSTETIGREDESTWRIKRRNAKWKLYSIGREKDGWLEVASYDTTKRVRSIKGNAALSGSKQLECTGCYERFSYFSVANSWTLFSALRTVASVHYPNFSKTTVAFSHEYIRGNSSRENANSKGKKEKKKNMFFNTQFWTT